MNRRRWRKVLGSCRPGRMQRLLWLALSTRPPTTLPPGCIQLLCGGGCARRVHRAPGQAARLDPAVAAGACNPRKPGPALHSCCSGRGGAVARCAIHHASPCTPAPLPLLLPGDPWLWGGLRQAGALQPGHGEGGGSGGCSRRYGSGSSSGRGGGRHDASSWLTDALPCGVALGAAKDYHQSEHARILHSAATPYIYQSHFHCPLAFSCFPAPPLLQAPQRSAASPHGGVPC